MSDAKFLVQFLHWTISALAVNFGVVTSALMTLFFTKGLFALKIYGATLKTYGFLLQFSFFSCCVLLFVGWLAFFTAVFLLVSTIGSSGTLLSTPGMFLAAKISKHHL